MKHSDIFLLKTNEIYLDYKLWTPNLKSIVVTYNSLGKLIKYTIFCHSLYSTPNYACLKNNAQTRGIINGKR